MSRFANIHECSPFLLYPFNLDMALEFRKKSIVLLVGKYVPPRNNLIFGSDFDNVEFYAVSAWYRKFFDTEKAVPPKKSIFVRKRRY